LADGTGRSWMIPLLRLVSVVPTNMGELNVDSFSVEAMDISPFCHAGTKAVGRDPLPTKHTAGILEPDSRPGEPKITTESQPKDTVTIGLFSQFRKKDRF
jgi:hypothetical protein